MAVQAANVHPLGAGDMSTAGFQSLRFCSVQAIPGAVLFARPTRLLHHFPFAAAFHPASTRDRHWMGAFSAWTGLSLTGLALWPIVRNADLLKLIAQDLWFEHSLHLPAFEGGALAISVLLIGTAARVGMLTVAGAIARSRRSPTPQEKRAFEDRYEVTLFSTAEHPGGQISGYIAQDPRLYLHEGFAVPWGRWERLRRLALPALLGQAEMRWMGLERMHEPGRRYPRYWPLYLYARALQQNMAWLALLLPANNSVRGKILETSDGPRPLAIVKRRAYDRLLQRMKVDEKDRPALAERMTLRTMPFKRSRTFYSQWRMLLWQQFWVPSFGLFVLHAVHRQRQLPAVLFLYVVVSAALAGYYAVFDFSRAVGDANMYEYTVRLRHSMLQFDVLVHQVVAHEGIHILKALGYLATDITTSAVEALTVYEDLQERPFFRGRTYTDLHIPHSPVSKASLFHSELVHADILKGYAAMAEALKAFALNETAGIQKTRMDLAELAREQPGDTIGRGGENYSLSRRLGGMAIAIYDAFPLAHDDTGGLPWLFIRHLSAGKSTLDAFDECLTSLFNPQADDPRDPVVLAPPTPWRSTIHFHWIQHALLDGPLIASIIWLLHPVPIAMALGQWLIYAAAWGATLFVAKRRRVLHQHPAIAYLVGAVNAAMLVVGDLVLRRPIGSAIVIAGVALAYTTALYTAYRSYFMSGSNRASAPLQAAA